MRRISFAGLILFFCLGVFSQTRLMDSLKIEFKKATHDSTRCNILNSMIENESNDTIWPLYNEQLYKIAKTYYGRPKSETRNYFLKFYALSLNNFGYFEHAKRYDI
jgi:hypothetical protein